MRNGEPEEGPSVAPASADENVRRRLDVGGGHRANRLTVGHGADSSEGHECKSETPVRDAPVPSALTSPLHSAVKLRSSRRGGSTSFGGQGSCDRVG